MTRRDFQALAEAIAQAKREIDQFDCAPSQAIRTLERQIISVCKRQNANFDEARFLAAAAGPGR